MSEYNLKTGDILLFSYHGDSLFSYLVPDGDFFKVSLKIANE